MNIESKIEEKKHRPILLDLALGVGAGMLLQGVSDSGITDASLLETASEAIPVGLGWYIGGFASKYLINNKIKPREIFTGSVAFYSGAVLGQILYTAGKTLG